MNCVYCHGMIEDPKLAYRRVQGWERRSPDPRRRSGSDVTLREHLDEFACPSCIRGLKLGVAPAQGSLSL